MAGTITHSEGGRLYKLNDRIATLIIRPRGWHLEEAHVLVDGTPMSGALFDFGLYLFHNAKALRDKGSGPYFYLPKMRAIWRRSCGPISSSRPSRPGLPHGNHPRDSADRDHPAAYEMDEILYQLRDYASGLNCGRWDIFNFIKKFRNRPDFVLPDRNAVTMAVPFLRAYSLLLIKTCHRRGAHAMGGMAAFTPIKSDPEANRAAIERVRADKLREASDGHDGTWAAHPGLVPIAKEIFDEYAATEPAG